jgi:hypothetical protein
VNLFITTELRFTTTTTFRILLCFLSAVFLIHGAIPGSFAQSGKPAAQEPDLQAYVGTWQAKLNGKVFQTIKLELSQGKITGTVSRGNVGVNDEGEIISAEVLEGTDPIVDAKAGFGLLRIKIKPREEEALSQFDLKLTGTDTAELSITGIPDAEKIKPWKLERVKAAK